MLEQTTAYGLTFSFPAHDEAVGRCLRDHGEFARVEADLAGQLARDGAFVDVGANIGAISLPVARQARRVVALEAHAGLAAVLRTNAERNGLSNVEVVQAAAGPEAGVVRFPTPPLTDARNFGDNGLARADDWLAEVPMTTLDALAPDDTRVIKIDVQGYELEVLHGAERVLTELRPALIVEVGHDSPRARRVIAHLQARRYRCYWLFSPFVTRTAERNPPREAFPTGDFNVACFPAGGAQPREMKPVDLAAGWPHHARDFPYLRRYGFKGAS